MEANLPAKARRRGRASLAILLMSILCTFSLFLSACGSSGTDNPGSSATPKIAPPADLITAGTLTVGSDTTYPPQEFQDTATQQAVGFDIDLITAMAQRMGLKASIKVANFSTIIDDLSAKRYDVAISALTINDERKQKADFVPYFNAGASLLVQKGNPEKISKVSDLCGKAVGVQTNTIELDSLNAASKDCETAGKSKISLTVLDSQTDVIQLLVDKRVVATYQDSSVTDYFLQQNNDKFQLAGTIVDAAPEGIAVRKGDAAMLKAMQDAFNAIKADGTYNSLFSKWHLNASQKIA